MKGQKQETKKMNQKHIKCGICGSTKNLEKTECCGEWVCMDNAVAANGKTSKCHPFHRRYTICSYHHDLGHDGDWNDCQMCKDSFPKPVYVEMSENDYNFRRNAQNFAL